MRANCTRPEKVKINTGTLSYDNTITFQGEVSDETCSVVINGNQAKPVVLLPTVSTKDLSEQGKTAGPIT
ncbi:type 1 fimbrial protein, partial [Salmonella enterica subsp. enterica serovar Typhimurium]